MGQILLIDDDPGFRSAARELLEALGYEVTTAHSVATAKVALQSERLFERIFLDLMLPDGSGLEVLEAIPKNELCSVQVTIITGHPALKAMVKNLGGPRVDYLVKPIDLPKLKRILGHNGDARTGINGVPLPPEKHFGFLIGNSHAMQELYAVIERVANTRANVMLTGESGVGKDLVAKAIHHVSLATGPFVAANCGTFSKELINSELFGQEKGALTGANEGKAGLFEQAQEGTLFLDEITEMPVELQPNLLRVLESKTVTRLGGNTPIPYNCRVISATNQSEVEIAENECLREDLYFRLAVFPIRVPALRERPEDIPLLARYFLYELNQEHGTNFDLSDESLGQLQGYDWPGNVRELRHVIYRAFIMSDPEQNQLVLPPILFSPYRRKQLERSLSSIRIEPGRSIEEVERDLIRVTLDALNGDKRKAAKILGVSLKTLYNRLHHYETETRRSPNVVDIDDGRVLY